MTSGITPRTPKKHRERFGGKNTALYRSTRMVYRSAFFPFRLLSVFPQWSRYTVRDFSGLFLNQRQNVFFAFALVADFVHVLLHEQYTEPPFYSLF